MSKKSTNPPRNPQRERKIEALKYVRLPKRVCGDFPFLGRICCAGPGIYEAHLNPHGAVSVIANDGKLLGVKPGEFEFVDTPASPSPATDKENDNG